MKVIVADKISERGVKLLQEQPGWNIVLTNKDNLNAEIADAQALIVRSATKVTSELLDKAPKLRCVGRFREIGESAGAELRKGMPAAIGELHVVTGLTAATVADHKVGVMMPGQIIDGGTLAFVPETQAHGDDGTPHGCS